MKKEVQDESVSQPVDDTSANNLTDSNLNVSQNEDKAFQEPQVETFEQPTESSQTPVEAPTSVDNSVNNLTMDQGNVNSQPITSVNEEGINNTAQNVGNNTMPATLNNSANKIKDTFNNVLTKIKSLGMVPVVGGAIVLVVLVAGLILKVATGTPKAVFSSQLDNIYKKVNNTVNDIEDFKNDFALDKNALLLKADIKADSNAKSLGEDVEILKKLSLAGEVGIDVNEEQLYVAANIKGAKNDIGAKVLYKDGSAYIESPLLEKVVELDEIEEIDFTSIKEALEQLNEQLDGKELDTYMDIVKTLKDTFTKSLDSKYMKKQSAKFEVDGKKVSATKNTLVLNEDSLPELVTKITEKLLDDDKFLSNFAKAFDIEKSDVKDVLKELKNNAKDIELSDDININIYTKGLLNSMVGFSVEVDEEEYFSIYSDGKNTEIIVDNHLKSSSKMKLVINLVGTKKNIEYSIKYNGTKIASGTIREMSEKLIDFDVKYSNGDDEFVIAIYTSCDKKKNSISGEYKFGINFNDEYINVSGNYSMEGGALNVFKTDDAISYDEIDEEELMDKAMETIEDDEVLNSILGSTIEDYEESLLDLNYNDMKEVDDIASLKKVLSKSKPTVLYIGESYYSSYSEEEAYNLLKALETAQYDLDFYSYAYDTSYMSNELKELFEDVTYVCKNNINDEETTPEDNDDNSLIVEENVTTDDNTITDVTEVENKCQEIPAIYLIKDGKIVKAFQGSITVEELEKELEELGL